MEKNVNSKSHKLIIVNKLGAFCSPFSYLEIVERKINWESLIKLAELFNVTLEHILSTEEKETIISKDILEKLNEFYYKNKK